MKRRCTIHCSRSAPPSPWRSGSRQPRTPRAGCGTPTWTSIVDEVVVTGTRVAARTRLGSLAPVDVLPQEALDLTRHHRARRSAVDAAPSLNFPRPSITDGTDHIRPATLRGLAPDQTLVLVNSKRRHPVRAGERERLGGPRLGRRRSQRHSAGGHRIRRSAARWRLRAIRLGRHRRCHQPAPARCARGRQRHRHLWRVQHRRRNRTRPAQAKPTAPR